MLADLKMNHLLKTIDEWADAHPEQLPEQCRAPEIFPPTHIEDSPPLLMNLEDDTIQTIIWCTGYRPDYSWLNLPIFDCKGYIQHEGGIVDSPGLYLIGTTFLRRRKSSFIHGAEDDARDLCQHLFEYLSVAASH